MPCGALKLNPEYSEKIKSMYINNYKNLATSELREVVLEMIEAGLRRSEPHNMIKDAVQYNHDFNSVIVQHSSHDMLSGRIFVIGGGKAVGKMAEELERIIGVEHITAGVINCKTGGYNLKKIKLNEASHPLPDKRGVAGTNEILKLKDDYQIGEKDLVIILLSGGGSSLITAPVEGVTLDDKQKITRVLLDSGADISDVNIVRKHLSKVKGGQLGAYFSPAKVATLIISDVARNNLASVASGPAHPDDSTFEQSYEILKKYNLWDSAPTGVKNYIERGVRGQEIETPKTLENCSNYLIGSTAVILEAAALSARESGFNPIIISDEVSGNSVEVARDIAKMVIDEKYASYNVLLFGGETSYKANGKKSVGRNQQFVAQLILELKNYPGEWVTASFDSDGIDYLSKTAGAIADNNTLVELNKMGVNLSEVISNNDTEKILEKLKNALILTGDTKTNVGDVMIFLRK